MRIIRGKLKSKRFSLPKGFPSRPTTDFAKEGLFNILEHRYELKDQEILDLCAGTGNMSFEFCSRDAGMVTSVDINRNCIAHIQKFVTLFDITDSLKVICSNALSFLKKTENQYDIVFFDPPYESPIYDQCIQLIFKKNLLKPNGILIVEHNKQKDFSTYPEFIEQRSFGNVYFSFLNRVENE